MIDQIKPLANKLTKFCQKKLGFESPPKLFLKSDEENSRNPLGRTAHYNPNEKSVTIFVTGRHIKDVLRSLSHELVHHHQNLRGDLAPEKCGNLSAGYAQDNEHMRNMEKEAYLLGNMNFRDWEDGCKLSIKESRLLKENKIMSTNKSKVKINKRILKKLIERIVAKRLTLKEFGSDPAYSRDDALGPEEELESDSFVPEDEGEWPTDMKPPPDSDLDSGYIMPEDEDEEEWPEADPNWVPNDEEEWPPPVQPPALPGFSPSRGSFA